MLAGMLGGAVGIERQPGRNPRDGRRAGCAGRRAPPTTSKVRLDGALSIIRARFAGTERPPDGDRFDLIFLDPPYGLDDMTEALAAAEQLVLPGTLLVLEHAKRDEAPAVVGPLVRTRLVKSGDSALAMYERQRF